MKLLNLPIIEETEQPFHDCGGHCSGNNGRDGFCYHADGTRHPVGACRAAEKRRARAAAEASK